MAYNDPQLVHIDQALTNLSTKITNAELVGDLLFPALPVQKQSDKYWQYKNESFRVLDDFRAPGTSANEYPPATLSTDTYFTQEHALKALVTDEEVKNADSPISPAADAAELLTDAILLKREDLIQTKARLASNYPAAHTVTLAGADQWSDPGSDPIDDVKTGRDQVHSVIFKNPNLMIMGHQVGTKLEDHPDVIERIKYTQRGVGTDEILASLFTIPRVVRGSAGKNTAALNATESISYMWGKDVVLAYVAPRPAPKVVSYGFEFVEPYGGGAVMPTERWRDNDRGGDWVRTRRKYDLKFTTVDSTGDTIAGYLIKSAIA